MRNLIVRRRSPDRAASPFLLAALLLSALCVSVVNPPSALADSLPRYLRLTADNVTNTFNLIELTGSGVTLTNLGNGTARLVITGTSGGITNITGGGTWTLSNGAYTFVPATDASRAATGTVFTVTGNGNSGSVTLGTGGTIALGSDASKVTTNAALDRLRLNDGGGLTNLPSSGGGGLTNAALYHAAGEIVGASTCYREGSRWTRFTATSCTLYFPEVFIPDAWATNMQWAILSGAYSGISTATYELCATPFDGSTNYPTGFTVTNSIVAISGSLNYTNATQQLSPGYWTLRLRWLSGDTNLVSTIERRAL